ncbi:hypothetical protein KJ068_13920 [bacterium]|nr:hypothetical protein [bacterium]RIK57494.1 MAG: hypothetical protein DCC62_29850 [candidate division KSB1 bacterium]
MNMQRPKPQPPEDEPVSYQRETTPPANQVAEPMAAYHVQRQPPAEKKSGLPARQIGGYQVSREVWQFAVVNDLLPHLETAVRLVYDCFAAVKKIEFVYVIDPELENNSWITIEAAVSGTVEEVLAQTNQFDREMIKQVPIEKGAMICLVAGGF